MSPGPAYGELFAVSWLDTHSAGVSSVCSVAPSRWGSERPSPWLAAGKALLRRTLERSFLPSIAVTAATRRSAFGLKKAAPQLLAPRWFPCAAPGCARRQARRGEDREELSERAAG